MHRLLHGKIESFAHHYRGEKFHALLCDPPYHLVSPSSNSGSQPINGVHGRFGRIQNGKSGNHRGGFMGKKWDGGDVAFNSETWAMLAEHLYDGAFGMAFASSRGWHRLACAIEDAGLIIHPSIFGWAFGSGFPKATRIDTQIDAHGGKDISWFIDYVLKVCDESGIKRKDLTALFPSKNGNMTGWLYNKQHTQRLTVGQYNKIRDFLHLPFDTLEAAERVVVGKGVSGIGSGDTFAFNQMERGVDSSGYDLTAPATPLAATWAGHRYGLQALKPALEPIIVFQKSYRGKPVECITQTGAGALWIDGTRIGSESHIVHGKEAGRFQPTGGDTIKDYHAVDGRWPANLVLSHSPSCNGSCADGCAVKALGEQSGETSITGKRKDRTLFDFASPLPLSGKTNKKNTEYPNDTGTAARFFFNVDWQYEVAEQLANADPVRYQAKASRSERDAGLDGFPEKEYSPDTLSAGIERKNGKRDEASKSKTPFHNVHPTVKPIALARWLATLLLPPAAYAPRRILVPFAGVASEMIGAELAGWDVVVGIEQDAEYCEIGEARLGHWTEQPALIAV